MLFLQLSLRFEPNGQAEEESTTTRREVRQTCTSPAQGAPTKPRTQGEPSQPGRKAAESSSATTATGTGAKLSPFRTQVRSVASILSHSAVARVQASGHHLGHEVRRLRGPAASVFCSLSWSFLQLLLSRCSRMPNPSFEPTRSGRPLQAFISFSALRVLPPRAAQLKR